jgi:phospho-N-acetylmuramoyl-pentapeptide-transferase
MSIDVGALWLGLVGLCAACVLSAALTGLVLRAARAVGARQIVRDDGPQAHLKKQGTPSLGGIGFILAFVIVAVVVIAVAHAHGVPCAAVLWVPGLCLAFGAIGFYDDYRKFALGIREGWKARYRIVAEFLIAALFALLVLQPRWSSPEATLFVGLNLMGLGKVGWLATSVLALVGSVNAVNLSDGLDGLAGGLTAICAAALGAALFATGQPGLGIAALSLGGAALGFLWLNGHPASIFMGDVGSYGLGAGLAAISLLAGIELVYGVMGFVFVLEALSVIAQVISFRTTGRRVLRMSPLHHHFELCGWPETWVVMRFWTVGALCGVAGLLLVLSRA